MCELTNKKTFSVGSSALMASITMLLSPVDGVAASLNSHDAFYLNASGNVAIGQNNEARSELYRHGGGFHLSEAVDIGIADVYLGNERGEPSTRGAELYLRRLEAVGELAQLYVDAGVTTFGDHFSVGTGMLYALNDHIDIDVGYRYYADASVAQGDTYSFGLGLQYNFADREIAAMQAPQAPQVQSRVVKATPEIIEPTPEVIEPTPEVIEPTPEVIEPAPKIIEAKPKEQSTPVCSTIWRSPSGFMADPQQTTVRYEIQEGDWAIKIARRHCTTLEVLLALNPWLTPRVVANHYIYPGEALMVPNVSE